jgi:CDP-glucose 4,6-dehydratase
MGAKVHGYSLDPATKPSFFEEIRIAGRLASSVVGDVRDLPKLSKAVAESEPEVVIHLAAQALVRESYANPVDTFTTNLTGTMHLLESCRSAPTVKSVVVVTSDKCYANNEWVWPYRENDRLGGRDPYSASKAASELVVASYRDSFLADSGIHVATARAGNVIGGGDWSTDRLIPDFLRSLESGEPLQVRSPNATRPWQHVLEPLSGYLILAESLHSQGEQFAGPWNFGPGETGNRTVGWVVGRLAAARPHARWEPETSTTVHEAEKLSLDTSKAQALLHWAPQWSLETALDKTLEWHETWKSGANISQKTTQQIMEYVAS